MNLKTMVPLIVALALGVVAAKIGKDMINKRQDGGNGMKLAKQVVAKEDLAPGSTIKDTDVVLKDVPADGAHQFTFSTVGEVLGRVVTTQIVKGQTVLDTLLAPAGATGGVQAMVPPGMRAVTLEVNEFSGVGGLLMPGSRVDLVQTIQVKGEESGLMAKTIVENLRVLAVGRRLSSVSAAPGAEPEAIARSVTVLATTEQSEAIDLASHVGSPRLVLRNSGDNKLTGGKGITVAALRGAEDKTGPNPIDSWIAQILQAATPTTRPSEPAKVETAKATQEFREVEVIRAGASTSVKMGVAPRTTLTGGAEKLLGEVPRD